MKMTKLISLRKSRKMTQEEMSKLIGVSSRTYASWEAGVSEMRAGGLRKISEILEIPMENIFNDSPEIAALRALPPSPTATPPSEISREPNGFYRSSESLSFPIREAKTSNNIEIEIELPSKSKVRFSIPADTDEDKISKLITNITN